MHKDPDYKRSAKKKTAAKKKPAKKDMFIQGAVKEMKAKGTEGDFSAAAKKEGMSTLQYAKKVLKPGSMATAKTKKRANFAKNMIEISRRRKKK